MQEETMKAMSKTELMAMVMETDRNLAVLQTQIAVLERTCKERVKKSSTLEIAVLKQIFGFDMSIPTSEATLNKIARAAKAREAKAAKRAESVKSPADKLKEIAEAKKNNQLTATPKDYTLLRALQKEGLTVDEMVKETHYTKESILMVLNDIPKLKEIE